MHIIFNPTKNRSHSAKNRASENAKKIFLLVYQGELFVADNAKLGTIAHHRTEKKQLAIFTITLP